VQAALGMLVQHAGKSNTMLLVMMRRVMGYLKRTANCKWSFSAVDAKGNIGNLTAHVDASFNTREVSNCNSRTGISFTIGEGSLLNISNLQSLVAGSSTEAELIAACEASKRILAARQSLSELGCPQGWPTFMGEDNEALVKIVTGARGVSARTRHLAVRAGALRWLQHNGIINMVHIAGDTNVADVLTKALPFDKFKIAREKLGVHVD
jgi:hypothetical protein